MANYLDKTLLRINAAIMTNRWDLDIERNPGAHKALNPIFLTINQELRYIKTIVTKSRAEKMRKLYIEDFLTQEQELREVGLAYIDTQP